jgi:molybdate transport system permease protein
MILDFTFSDGEAQAIGLSLVVALRAAAIGLPLAIAVALALARGRFIGRVVLDGIVHLPLVLPPVVTGFLLLLLFGRTGPIGHWLEQALGLRLAFTIHGAVLATLVMILPLMTRQIRLSLDAIEPGLEQAAAGLGAGRVDRFFTITLPLMGPGIVSGFILGFVAALGEFGAVITFAASIPGETRTIPLAIYGALQAPDGEQAAMRLAVISIAIGLGGLLVADAIGRYLRRRILGA